jgi:hypothetical protein
MRRRVRLALVLSAAVALAPTAGGAEQGHDAHSAAPAPGTAIVRTPRPADAKLYIISPTDGETVTSPVTVRFGLTGMGVAPAGVGAAATGHHHLLIDAELPPMDLPVPKDDHHLHFGGGQTEAVVTLAPGKHTLQLVLGDKDHVPHDPPLVSERITITVR